MTTVEVFAPAKINLTLHITGQRPDGYHLIDSIVAFAPVGDVLSISPADALSLQVDGPESRGVPDGHDNLVLKAAELLADGRGAELHLTKHLPVASGVGGGSADAAAAIRGLLLHWMDDAEADRLSNAAEDELMRLMHPLLSLGADVPMCLLSRSCRVGGIGEKLDFVELPPLPGVVVNPRVPVSTPDVFKALTTRENPPMPEELPDFHDAGALIGWLAAQRNDLEPPARAIAPPIDTALSDLRATQGCRLARMSGSGATCFALYDSTEIALAAADEIGARHPNWWISAGMIADWSGRAMPSLS